MHPEHIFNIVKVTANTGSGMNFIEKYDKKIYYNGRKVTVKLQSNTVDN
jgi:hypothetical protein